MIRLPFFWPEMKGLIDVDEATRVYAMHERIIGAPAAVKTEVDKHLPEDMEQVKILHILCSCVDTPQERVCVRGQGCLN